MILVKKWPTNMEYVTCDSYTGMNTPQRSLNLKYFFVKVDKPATFGTFTFKKDVEFNGYSRLTFDMDILGVAVRNGIGNECSEKYLGRWLANFSSPFRMDSMKDIGEINSIKIYRVSTIVVKHLL